MGVRFLQQIFAAFNNYLIPTVYTGYMDTQLLQAIRNIIREEVIKIVREEFQVTLEPINARLNRLELKLIDLKTITNTGFKRIDIKLTRHDVKFREQDHKLDTILEAWDIQRVHREELNDHEKRIQIIEHRIPVIS